MIPKCPGQDNRYLKIETLHCPYCGYNLEIFSDEIKTKCPGCKTFVFRVKLPSCVVWCKAARECIGEEKWKQFKGEA